jgi:dihydroorotase-like cyclic amidohydrolase
MKILIQNGRVVDPASGFDQSADVALADGRIVGIGAAPDGFEPDRRIDASGLVVAPGLVDLSARLGEPGHEHEGLLQSELAAAVAGGVTSLVCPPDTDPVLDEPGLVEMLRSRAERLQAGRRMRAHFAGSGDLATYWEWRRGKHARPVVEKARPGAGSLLVEAEDARCQRAVTHPTTKSRALRRDARREYLPAGARRRLP